MSSTGPEVLPGSNQGPTPFLILTLYFLLKVIRQDIRPATLSSWLKQLIYYKQADQQSLDLVQVKAHDIRAFLASKAFYGGFFLVDQIIQSCHWKAHNTFTNFTFKTLFCQIMTTYISGSTCSSKTSPKPFPSDSSSLERKEGGHLRYSQVFRSLNPGSRYKHTFAGWLVRSFIVFMLK